MKGKTLGILAMIVLSVFAVMTSAVAAELDVTLAKVEVNGELVTDGARLNLERDQNLGSQSNAYRASGRCLL